MTEGWTKALSSPNSSISVPHWLLLWNCSVVEKLPCTQSKLAYMKEHSRARSLLLHCYKHLSSPFPSAVCVVSGPHVLDPHPWRVLWSHPEMRLSRRLITRTLCQGIPLEVLAILVFLQLIWKGEYWKLAGWHWGQVADSLEGTSKDLSACVPLFCTSPLVSKNRVIEGWPLNPRVQEGGMDFKESCAASGWNGKF